MKIAVTGAAGWLGGAICRHLQNRGFPTLKIVRNAVFPDEVSWDFAADENPSRLGEALGKCSSVIHCAAYVHRTVETPADERLFQQINVEGTRRLVMACQAARVRRLVLASSIAVYDWTIGGSKIESDSVRGTTGYARSKLQSEQIVRQSGMEWRIARIATVFGIGDHANFLRLARALRKRRFFIPGRGLARKSVISVDAAASVLCDLADSPLEVLLNVASPHAPSLQEICAAFSNACGFHPAPRLPVSAFRFIAVLGDLISALGGRRFPMTSNVLQKLTTDTVVDTSLLRRMLPGIEWLNFADAVIPAAEFYRTSS